MNMIEKYYHNINVINQIVNIMEVLTFVEIQAFHYKHVVKIGIQILFEHIYRRKSLLIVHICSGHLANFLSKTTILFISWRFIIPCDIYDTFEHFNGWLSIDFLMTKYSSI